MGYPIYSTKESRWICGLEAAAVSRKAVLSVSAEKPGFHTHRKWGLPPPTRFIIITKHPPPSPAASASLSFPFFIPKRTQTRAGPSAPRLTMKGETGISEGS